MAAATISTSSLFNLDSDVDKLSHEIFSILENKFLFGYNANATTTTTAETATPLHHMKSTKHITGKVRILTIDGGGATDGVLAAKSLVHLESCIRRKSGHSAASVSDYFDVVSGSGAGGILAALLFTKAADGSGRPLCTAQEALDFLLENRRKIFNSSPAGIFRRVFRPAKTEKERERLFRKTFGNELTMKDTIKSVLIPCYDMSSCAPFLFSRADAVEMDGYDFKMKDVCAATCANPAAVEAKSVDGRTKIMAVDGGIAMNNPTAAAITHVLNNRQEFPFCSGVEDLMVVSLGNGESDQFGNLSPSGCLRIAGEGASDLVDQAVSMAFGQCRTTNYVRVQATGTGTGGIAKSPARISHSNKNNINKDILALTEEMLSQKNLESILFEGKRMGESTNLKKLELFAGEVIKEEERRKTSILPTVALKQTTTSASSPARTSSATTLSSLSSSC